MLKKNNSYNGAEIYVFSAPVIKLYLSFILLLFISCYTALVNAAYPVKPTNEYISDYVDLITTKDHAKIQALLADLRSQHDIEVFIVTIRSIKEYETNDKTIESFATNLFNYWGIGRQDKNDGILLLVALKERKVRIEVGEDYGSRLNAKMKYVIDESIVPYFRESDYSEGIYQGTKAIIAQLFPSTQETTDTETITSDDNYIEYNDSYEIKYESRNTSSVVDRIDIELPENPIAAILLISSPFFIIIFFIKTIKTIRRYRTRKCPYCRIKMQKLNERMDDIYLDQGAKNGRVS